MPLGSSRFSCRSKDVVEQGVQTLVQPSQRPRVVVGNPLGMGPYIAVMEQELERMVSAAVVIRKERVERECAAFTTTMRCNG